MTIKGDRVNLRAIELDDAKTIHVWNNDSEFMRNYAYQPEHVISKAEMDKEVEALASNKDKHQRVFMIAKKEDGKPIGLINFGKWQGKHISVEVGLGIGERSEQGKGYGQEAMNLLVSFLFDELNVHRIELKTLADNPGAIKCFEKCGFREEGRLREAVYFDGQYHDLLMMSVLKTD